VGVEYRTIESNLVASARSHPRSGSGNFRAELFKILSAIFTPEDRARVLKSN